MGSVRPALYVLLGALWLMCKTSGALATQALGWAKLAWLPMGFALLLISIADLVRYVDAFSQMSAIVDAKDPRIVHDGDFVFFAAYPFMADGMERHVELPGKLFQVVVVADHRLDMHVQLVECIPDEQVT